MKYFNVDLEAVFASAYGHGMTEVQVQMTVRERIDPTAENSVLNMSEANMRLLHKLLGNHIRALDEYEGRT